MAIHESLIWNGYALPVALVSTVIFCVGFFVYLQNPKALTNRSFFLISLCVNLWLYGICLVTSIKDEALALRFYRTITFLGVSHVATCVYFFSAVWLNLATQQKRAIRLGFFGSAVFYITGLFSNLSFRGVYHYYWGFYPHYGPLNILFLVFFFSYFLMAFFNFINAYQKEPPGIHKKQIQIIAVGFLIALTGSEDYISKLFEIPLYPFGYISVFGWILLVAYSIIKYKVMDIQTVIHKTFMWFMTTVIAMLPFAYVIHRSYPWIAKLSQLEITLCFVAVLLTFYAYYRAIQPQLDQLFRRQGRNLQRGYTKFSEELVHLKNMPTLLRRLTRTLRSNLFVRYVSIYLIDEAQKELVPAIVKGVRGVKSIPLDHPFLKWIAIEDKVTIAALAESNPDVKVFKNDYLNYVTQTQAVVIVPLVAGGKILGIIHLGTKENLKNYSPSDINFLTQLKFPVTIALSNSQQFENVSRLYEQVQHQNIRLKELDRLKSEFLANTSHELRTPLNGILGLVESLLEGADGPLNADQRRHLQMITDSGLGLKELINNLLELSRRESGQMKLHGKKFNVLNVVDAVTAMLEDAARKKKIKLESIHSAGLPDCWGDPEKIQRILMNLVGNAIKFTLKGKVTIKVEDEPSTLFISVQDTGIGIAPEDQKIIFERFRQVDSSMTRSFEGTGLGLSIARELVQLHGGELELESEIGRGSCFSFRVPKTPEHLQMQTQESAEERIVESRNPSFETSLAQYGKDIDYQTPKGSEAPKSLEGHGEKILIVDDNVINREVVKIQLEMSQYVVVEASDGFEALEKIPLCKPDLIILDLMMPRMSGYEFCREVRASHSEDQLPVIMLTAKTDMGDKIYGLNLGANDYISKPFNKEELLARVRVLLKIRKMNQDLKRWNDQLERMVDERTQELTKTQGQLIQAEKLATIGTLAGGVAHEINNPLTAVLTNAQILKMTATGDDLESLSLIEEGAKRCQSIVQKLLKYARQPQAEAGMKTVDLGQVIRNAHAMLHYQLAQDNIDIGLDISGEFPVEAVANELEQVFTNLIVNARDAVKSAGRPGRIRIRLEDQKALILAAVDDNGTGIKKEHLGRIFDPFFTTKEVGSGTGLGLAVTQSILQKHKVQVEVQSKENEGTTFLLYFKKK